MDNGLVQARMVPLAVGDEVLILVVVEDGLVHVIRNAETGTRVIKS